MAPLNPKGPQTRPLARLRRGAAGGVWLCAAFLAATSPLGAQEAAGDETPVLLGFGAETEEELDVPQDGGQMLPEEETPVGAQVADPPPELLSSRQNLRMQSVDGIAPVGPDQPPEDETGIRAGRYLLRPSLTQRIAVESNRSGNTRDERTYSETEAALQVISDWSRHELRIDGSGAFEKNLSGDAPTDPSAGLDAVLRLDLSSDRTGALRAGYDFSREDETDPNALTGASVQAGVHTFTAGAGIAREEGLIRSSFDIDAERVIYGDAELADGSTLELDDRDEASITLTSRVGYALSPVLIPFIEAAATRTEFDERFDSAGYERSSSTYALRTGVEFDLGEKFFGEIAAGYLLRDIDDGRLASVDAFAIDGLVNWSPRRGTDVQLGLATVIDSSTTPGVSGNVAYTLTGGIAHQIRRNLVARLAGTLTLREFEGLSIANQTEYGANAGLTWSVNRHLDVVADAFYEKTTQDGVEDYDSTGFSVGMTLRR